MIGFLLFATKPITYFFVALEIVFQMRKSKLSLPTTQGRPKKCLTSFVVMLQNTNVNSLEGYQILAQYSSIYLGICFFYHFKPRKLLSI